MTKIQENCKQYSVDAQISKTSEAYQKKINDNLTKISQDLSTISGVTNNIDSCIPAYADLDRSYRQLVNYEPALNRESEELIKIFYKAKYFKEQRFSDNSGVIALYYHWSPDRLYCTSDHQHGWCFCNGWYTWWRRSW